MAYVSEFQTSRLIRNKPGRSKPPRFVKEHNPLGPLTRGVKSTHFVKEHHGDVQPTAHKDNSSQCFSSALKKLQHSILGRCYSSNWRSPGSTWKCPQRLQAKKLLKVEHYTRLYALDMHRDRLDILSPFQPFQKSKISAMANTYPVGTCQRSQRSMNENCVRMKSDSSVPKRTPASKPACGAMTNDSTPDVNLHLACFLACFLAWPRYAQVVLVRCSKESRATRKSSQASLKTN